MQSGFSMFLGILISILSLQVQAREKSLKCQFIADPSSIVSLGVDEAYGKSETVLLGVTGSRDSFKIKSALLPMGSLAAQIQSGTVIVSLGEDAKPADSEVFDGVLLAVKRETVTGSFKGYLAIQRDGTSILPIVCQAK